MPTLVVLNGRHRGEWYSFSERRPLVVGRDRDLLAEIIDPLVSHRHMEIRYDKNDGCFYAVDLDSKNGLYVNENKVNRFKALRETDAIRVGNTLMVFTQQDFADYRQAETFARQAQKNHADRIKQLDEKLESFTVEDSRLMNWFRNLRFRPR